MVKHTVKSFKRENKFHSYLTRETLPAEERVSKFHNHGETSSCQILADAEGVRRGSNTQVYSTAVKISIMSCKLQHLFPTKSSDNVLNKKALRSCGSFLILFKYFETVIKLLLGYIPFEQFPRDFLTVS